MGRICFNWKVLAGLAGVGLGVWFLAPDLVAGALPLLLLAICPLSMLLMMRGMQGGRCAPQPVQVTQPVRTDLTRDEQLTELKTQLAQVQAQQEGIARQIADLEDPRPAIGLEAKTPAGTVAERDH